MGKLHRERMQRCLFCISQKHLASCTCHLFKGLGTGSWTRGHRSRSSAALRGHPALLPAARGRGRPSLTCSTLCFGKLLPEVNKHWSLQSVSVVLYTKPQRETQTTQGQRVARVLRPCPASCRPRQAARAPLPLPGLQGTPGCRPAFQGRPAPFSPLSFFFF